MREKTAEEKLREELEGDSSGVAHDKELVRKLRAKKSARASNSGKKTDPFIDDFERKVEQSLNAGNIFKTPLEVKQHKEKEKPRAVKKTTSEIIPAVPQVRKHEEPKAQEEIIVPEVLPELEPEQAPVVEPEVLPQAELVEPEIIPEVEPEEPEQEQEIFASEPAQESEPEIFAPETPEIIVPEPEPEDEGELPDIPVIETDNSQEPSQDDDDNEILPEGELPDIPVIEADTEDNQPEQPAEEENSSPADIILNVDDELPILNEDFNEPDPETEAATLSVTMPESTKTAEDKLMADIAEAMTGSPLNLDSPEAPAPYQLPDNFMNANLENSDPSQQSAEEKLIANIAQAMNESPLDTAQEQARQDLEQDLNPFEEMNLPSPIQEEPEPEELTPELQEEEPQEQQENEQEFLPDFSDSDNENNEIDDKQENPDNEEFMPSLENEEPSPELEEQEPENEEFMPSPNIEEPSPENEEQSLELEEPSPELEDFTHSQDDEDQEPDNEDFMQVPELEEITQEPTNELEELTPEPEETHENENEDDEFHFNPEEAIALLGDDDDVEEDENVSENLTAEQRLQQEVAKMAQSQPDFNAGIISQNIQQEVQPENKMPEQSLLDNETDLDEESGDDWDISSLGALSEAATIPEDDPDDLTPQETPTTMIMNNPERAEQEKTMGIREKLAERKNAAAAKKSSSASNSSSSGGKTKSGFLLPILLGLLLIVGAFIAWQLFQISDKLSIAMMNSSGFENVSGFDVPLAYDYAIDFIIDPNLTERMAARGREGWQVVGSRRTQDSTTGQYGYEFIFMRRKSGR